MLKTRLSLAILILAAACRGGGDDDGGDGGGIDAGADDVSVYDVQAESMQVGAPVTLRGVVVTAVDTFGARKGGFYVQEPDGGPFSGVFVFAQGTLADELAVGDLVDVENAVKDEFALMEDETGRKLTELKAAEGQDLIVTKVGTMTPPTPPELEPWTLAASDDEAEKWEGVPVTFTGARVFFAPDGVSSSDETLKEMTVTGPFRVSSSLTDLADTIETGTCYASITGIGDYFFSYKILPRSADDLVVGADGDCLPAEATELLCQDDGVDNDYNGFADCADFSCQDAVAACVTDATIAEIQTGAIADNTRVRVTGALVVARSFNGSSLWIQTAGASAAENEGVFVFSQLGGEDFDAAITAGDTITITATLSEFDCFGVCAENPITELVGAVVESATDGAATPTPLEVTLAEAVAESYEGVLVTLDGVDTGMVRDTLRGSGGTTLVNREYEISQGGTTIHVDDDVFRASPAPTPGTCQSVTGIMHFNTRDDSETGGLAPHITIIPRSAGDVTSSAACP